MDSLVKSQKAAWIKRIIINPDAPWLQLLHQCIPPMHITDLLKCSVNPDDLSGDIPGFYGQVLYAWYQLRQEPNNALDLRRELLRFNDKIRIDNMSIFYKKMVAS